MQVVNIGIRAGQGGVSPYQAWSSYPIGTVLLADYPYQCVILRTGYNPFLCASKAPFYVNSSLSRIFQNDPYTGVLCELSGGVWGAPSTYPTYKTYTSIAESNHNIMLVPPNTTVFFAKTTP